ncbi:hypothetical protein [Cytobacillus sp. NCCP-133]|uniref:hypothetical protein n=1 Tax=Cytobacillus sp. NCCP-133 TaxID=766848 RepID=UPI00222FD031|nr:hypothetical protein [Cytobacillus sp. NCCP-133]GLB58023.1 hypothetical protein NCCP133_01560 [Cytobacillus sp. NCCP-133]
MYYQVLKLLTGLISGFLFIKVFPLSVPMSLSDMIVIFVLEPGGFFLGMVFFIISFLANAELIRRGIELTISLIKNNKTQLPELLISLTIIISFFILSSISIWETIGLFFFSVIYGIISLDFKKLNFAEDYK